LYRKNYICCWQSEPLFCKKKLKIQNHVELTENIYKKMYKIESSPYKFLCTDRFCDKRKQACHGDVIFIIVDE